MGSTQVEFDAIMEFSSPPISLENHLPNVIKQQSIHFLYELTQFALKRYLGRLLLVRSFKWGVNGDMAHVQEHKLF